MKIDDAYNYSVNSIITEKWSSMLGWTADKFINAYDKLAKSHLTKGNFIANINDTFISKSNFDLKKLITKENYSSEKTPGPNPQLLVMFTLNDLSGEDLINLMVGKDNDGILFNEQFKDVLESYVGEDLSSGGSAEDEEDDEEETAEESVHLKKRNNIISESAEDIINKLKPTTIQLQFDFNFDFYKPTGKKKTIDGKNRFNPNYIENLHGDVYLVISHSSLKNQDFKIGTLKWYITRTKDMEMPPSLKDRLFGATKEFGKAMLSDASAAAYVIKKAFSPIGAIAKGLTGNLFKEVTQEESFEFKLEPGFSKTENVDEEKNDVKATKKKRQKKRDYQNTASDFIDSYIAFIDSFLTESSLHAELGDYNKESGGFTIEIKNDSDVFYEILINLKF